jgi:phage major head subunit gpT-like protein
MSLNTSQAMIAMRAITARFDNGFADGFSGLFYPKIAAVVQSNRAGEEYGFMGAVPQVREWLGDRKFNQLRGAHFELLNRDWEGSLQILRNDLDDDVNGFYGDTLQDMGIRAATHPDSLVFDLINAGESTLCWDGQYFFDTDHSWGSSGSQSNDLGHSASDSAAPTAAEFKVSYHLARTKMQSFVDDRGQPLYQPTATGPNGLYVVVPPAFEQAAHEATRAEILGSSSNIVLGQPTVVSSPRLTETDSWYLLNSRSALKPFVFQERTPTTRSTKDDDEFKFVKFMTYGRYNAGYLGWWNAIKVIFS